MTLAGNVTASDQRTQLEESTARPMLTTTTTTTTTTTRALLSGTSYFLRSQGACGFSLLTYKSHQAALSIAKSSVVCNWTVVQAHPILNNMSLPTEIVELILEDFISEHPMDRTDLDSIGFIPQWYLTPLLRVCRLWNEVAEKYLYRSIAVGSKVRPPQLSRIKGESMHNYLTRKALLHEDVYSKRDGHELAEGLLATLTTSPRLAALVKTLQLGIQITNDDEKSPEWTRTNIRILQLCRNVENVEIRGFDHTELGLLVDVLKEKSLVSFCISKRSLPSARPCTRRRVGTFSQILGMMGKWSRLQRIRVEEFLDDVRSEDSLSMDTAQSSEWCPELQEIIFRGTSLFDFEFRALRSTSCGVTKLSVSLYGERVGERGVAAIDGLCECLRKWSSTLEYLKLDALEYRIASQSLNEAITGLRSLRELQVAKLRLELASISQLPQLIRFACLQPYHWTELESLLKDSSRFPSLTFIALLLRGLDEFEERIEDLCNRREITLEEWDHSWFYEFGDPALAAGFLL